MTVMLTIMDRKSGKRVSNVKKEDLQIFEDGVKREPAFFSRLDTPLSVFLLLDTSLSTRSWLKGITGAANVFIESLRFNDQLSIISFDRVIKEHLKLTKLIDYSVKEMKLSPHFGGTVLYDVIEFVVKKRMKDVRDRKIIILFTDGVDSGSHNAKAKENYYDIQESDAIIYPIQYSYAKAYPEYSRMKSFPSFKDFAEVKVKELKKDNPKSTATVKYIEKISNEIVTYLEMKQAKADAYLQELAYRTGGKLYAAENIENLSQAFASIIEEVSSQYVLCFYSPNPNAANKQRIVKVRTGNPDLIVRERVN